MIDWKAIKAKTDIASVIGAAVPLKKQAGLLKGCCPFHHEKTPSFTVYDDHAHCYGCGWHGDVVDFVMGIDNCDAAEAIRKLGAGEVAMDKHTSKIITQRQQQQDEARAKAIREANAIWERAEEASEAHPYLQKKKIGAHTARQEGNALIIPVRDGEGNIQSIQRIGPDGEKRFLKDAPMAGGRYHFGIAIGRTIVCEGFATGASIYESIPDRVTVAFSSAGVKERVRELHALGVDVVIAADRTGLADYIELGEELGVSVFVPPAPYDDFNDYAVAEGHDAVKACLRGDPVVNTEPLEKPATGFSAPANDETDPIDIWTRYDPPFLPTGLLPPLIERWAGLRAKQMGCDAGGLAMAGLAVCAAAIPDTIKVKVKEGDTWYENARLWVALIGRPSTMKSPMMRAAVSRLRDMDSELLAEFRQALGKWQQDKLDGNVYEKPVQTRIRIEDVTTEAAQEVIKTSPLGILAIQDELSGWFGGIEKYGSAKGAAKDRAFWLQAYNGGKYSVDRIGRESFEIQNLSISILGGIQPDVMRKICEDATDDGLIQRFMPVMLPRAVMSVDVSAGEIQNDYDALVERLRAIKGEGSFYETGFKPLRFSDEASEVVDELMQIHFELATDLEDVSMRFAAHVGKYNGMFARLALTFHCIENANVDVLPREISADTAKRAARFLHNYVFGHAKAFYNGLLGMSPDQEILEEVGGYIIANNIERVTARTFARGSTKMRKLTKWNIQPICEQLLALGWLEPPAKGASDVIAYSVNPRVHDVFNAKAEEEKERRAELRRVIHEVFTGNTDLSFD